jgi:hypothetical protein
MMMFRNEAGISMRYGDIWRRPWPTREELVISSAFFFSHDESSILFKEVKEHGDRPNVSKFHVPDLRVS